MDGAARNGSRDASSVAAALGQLEAPIVRPWGSDDPIVVDRAEGSHLWDIEGRRYLDLSGSAAACAVGHGHPRVVTAVQRQAGRLMHCPTGMLSEPRLAFARALSRLAPHGLERSVLAASGAAAVELAVRLAVATTGRTGIVTFTDAYHGGLGVARTLSDRGPAGDPFRTAGPLAIQRLRYPAGSVQRPADTVAAYLEQSSGSVAAIVIEPVLGSGGIIVPPVSFLAELRQLCDQHACLLIADEVQTGFGRTGRRWASEHSDIEPDLLVFGKGIGGGLAVSGLLGRPEIMSSLPHRSHAGTFLTNALNLAAATAAIEVLEEEQLVDRSQEIGQDLRAELAERLGRFPHVGEVRGRGLMIGVEIVNAHATSEPDAATAAAIARACRGRGVLVTCCGPDRNILKITPPLTIEPHDLGEATDSLVAAVRRI